MALPLSPSSGRLRRVAKGENVTRRPEGETTSSLRRCTRLCLAVWTRGGDSLLSRFLRFKIGRIAFVLGIAPLGLGWLSTFVDGLFWWGFDFGHWSHLANDKSRNSNRRQSNNSPGGLFRVIFKRRVKSSSICRAPFKALSSCGCCSVSQQYVR